LLLRERETTRQKKDSGGRGGRPNRGILGDCC
jgi:hypothetical protein